jgi:subtilisin family serine protease
MTVKAATARTEVVSRMIASSSRRIAILCTAATALLCAPAAAHASPGNLRPGPAEAFAEPVPGELIVRFARGADGAERSAARDSVDAEIERTLALGSSFQLLEVDGSVSRAVAELEENPDVVYAHPNYRAEFAAVPNDPQLGDLWGLRNTGQDAGGQSGAAGADVDAALAWDITTGSSSVKVAIIDSGVNQFHPDLTENLAINAGESGSKAYNGVDDDGNGKVDDWRGWDFQDGDNDPNDGNVGHGTHIAGTIGARGNNGVGVSGLNWQVSLLPIRVGGDTGGVSTANVVDAIAYASSQGARIANISIGGAYPAGSEPRAYLDAFRAAPNTLFAVAAGNAGEDNGQKGYFPCNYSSEPNVVCVAATDNRDALASFSNYGSTVQLAAPGKSILSTTPRYLLHENWDGTGTEWTTGGSPAGWGVTNQRAASGTYSVTDSPGGNFAATQDNWFALDDPVSTVRPDPLAFSSCFLEYKLRQEVVGNIVFQRFDVEMLTGNVPSWTSMGGQPPMWQGSTIGSGFQTFNIPLGVWQDSERLKVRFRFVANFGATSGDGAYVDDIKVYCGSGYGNPPDEYDEKSGTSMATPHVAGAAALVAAARPGASAAEIKKALVESIEPVPGLAGKVTSGGRLNVHRALLYPNMPPLPGGGGGGGTGPGTGTGGGPGTQGPGVPPANPILPGKAAAAFAAGAGTVAADKKGRRATVAVTCPAQREATCAGKVSATTSARFTRSGKVTRSRKGKALVLKAVAFKLPQGSSGTVQLALPKAATRELKRAGKLKLKLKLVPTGGKAVKATVTLKPARR